MACCNEVHNTETERVACAERKTLLRIATLSDELCKARRKLMAGLLAGQDMDQLEVDVQDKIRALELALVGAKSLNLIP